MDIRERLRVETKGYSMYNVRRTEYRKQQDDTINFRVSPTPFKLTKEQKEQIENIGKAICDYMDCCIELYRTDEHIHMILDKGKPQELKNAKDVKYLFLRPDLILTDNGFSICEIETSPFGLGLAEVLNSTYGNQGYETIIQQHQLKNYIQSQIKHNGTIAYSEKVKAFKGQLEFMATNIFSGNGNVWNAQKIGADTIEEKEIYRAFYLNEQFFDKNVATLLKQKHIYTPTSTPQFEEKALLSFIWNKRYAELLRSRLGESTFCLLRTVIPKTWIVGEEKYLDDGILKEQENSLSLVNLSKNNRKFVLKQSGFSVASSWGEGVKFLHKLSKDKTMGILKEAINDTEHLYIIQEFKQGKNIPMSFIDEEGIFQNMNARIRITPYYAYIGKDKGCLIAAKVTGCENTEYIHASTASINTAISYERTDNERD